MLHLPELDNSMSGEFLDLAEPVRLPGCMPIPPIQDKSDPCYRLIRADASDESCATFLDWIDRQPPKSVIFVSFGPRGLLSTKHMRELAVGLELNGQRFLLVVRSPSDQGAVNANHYDAESKNDPLAYFPERFVDSNDTGLLVPSWAPQTENTIMLIEGVRVAIREAMTKRKEEIVVAVREVTVGHGEGAEVRAKVAAMQKVATEALLEGGAATTALDEVVHKWTCGWYC
ncbi:hypothetical protein CFC21_039205 [Triticum aestivum]|uniref:Uncharacterized protein n=2 Tax=Triticum aestivum TaxID=4565 RepID=A0A9R1FE66_WHEAT|nr:hypothetical protein CFC21_039205 [Triticum aestivum]